MNKEKNRILYILFTIDILISVFFAIIPLIRDLNIGCLTFSLIYNIPTIIMLLSFLYLIPEKYNNLSIVALVGNIFMTTIFWYSTVTSPYWYALALVFGLFWNIVYGIVSLIISLLLKAINKNGS